MVCNIHLVKSCMHLASCLGSYRMPWMNFGSHIASNLWLPSHSVVDSQQKKAYTRDHVTNTPLAHLPPDLENARPKQKENRRGEIIHPGMRVQITSVKKDTSGWPRPTYADSRGRSVLLTPSIKFVFVLFFPVVFFIIIIITYGFFDLEIHGRALLL